MVVYIQLVMTGHNPARSFEDAGVEVLLGDSSMSGTGNGWSQQNKTSRNRPDKFEYGN
jgi:hypothetical protein